VVDKKAIPKHAKGEIEKVLKEARGAGWLALDNSPGHFANIVCQYGHADCWIAVWSTPKNLGNHARSIRQTVERCPGGE